MANHITPETSLSAWRTNREPQWYRDIGYTLQDILTAHHYDYTDKGQKPDDPGWHRCNCGWEGYWSDFQPHVADHLRKAVVKPSKTAKEKPMTESNSNDIESTVMLGVNGKTAEVQATTNPSTGVTDMDAAALDKAVVTLQRHADKHHLDDEDAVALFKTYVDGLGPDEKPTLAGLMAIFDADEE